MTKTVYYTYLGTNGTITSPVHLEDVYYTRKYSLRADLGKVITKDGVNFVKSAMVPEDEIDQWEEVKDPLIGQK
jgi:hypothetical protein